MKLYSVHYRHEDAASLSGLAERAVLVKEGFCWPALLFGPVWLAWRGLWLALAFYVALMLVAVAFAMLMGLPNGDVSLVTMVVNLLLALEGNGLCRWSLERRRYHERAIVAGGNLPEAEERFFASWSAAHKAVPQSPAAS
jgi:hypothetical protein